jgi:hypothetical protein
MNICCILQRKIDEGPMYIQMKQNPDTFELFIMSNSDKGKG